MFGSNARQKIHHRGTSKTKSKNVFTTQIGVLSIVGCASLCVLWITISSFRTVIYGSPNTQYPPNKSVISPQQVVLNNNLRGHDNSIQKHRPLDQPHDGNKPNENPDDADDRGYFIEADVKTDDSDDRMEREYDPRLMHEGRQDAIGHYIHEGDDFDDENDGDDGGQDDALGDDLGGDDNANITDNDIADNDTGDYDDANANKINDDTKDEVDVDESKELETLRQRMEELENKLHEMKALSSENENDKTSQTATKDYFDFTTHSLSLPFSIVDTDTNSFAFSAWIYLKPSSQDEKQSRYILSTKTFDCFKEMEATSGGISLYVNRHDTENQSLVLEYMTVKGCLSMESLGVIIPYETWTHIGVSQIGDYGGVLTLFVNGEKVAATNEDENDALRPIFTPSNDFTTIGELPEGGMFFEGHINMLAIWKDVGVDEIEMRKLYDVGLNSAKLMNWKSSDGKLGAPNYLYTFNLDEFGKEKMEGKMALLNKKAMPKPKPIQHKDRQTDPGWSPQGPGRYEDYKDGKNIFVSSPEIIDESDKIARNRRESIRDAMKHAWNGYKTYAWGQDELLPKSKKGQNNWGGMGTTLVDSLDTLWLMGMKDEFWEARDWVRDHLNNDINRSVSTFETTIRSLGGLLSAYDWSKDKAFLEKADDLGKRLAAAFNLSTGAAYSLVNLHTGQASIPSWTKGNLILAEAGTLQVEFRYLSEVTKMPDYKNKSETFFTKIDSMSAEHPRGLYPMYIHPKQPSGFETVQSKITFGANGDSFYEYMLKIWLQGGKKESMYRRMYDKAMDGVHEILVKQTKKTGLTYIAEFEHNAPKHKMDHLACFMAGSLALGAYTDPDGLESPKAQRDLKTGKALAYTCYQMYAQTKSGIGPEIADFPQGMEMKTAARASHYLLRPETVESLFILHQLTGDPTYREWGWEIFQAIEQYCKTDIAYGGLKNVNQPQLGPTDKMESFFLAETMKYLYLLQDPDTEVDILNKHVFNTEAHPLRRFDMMD